MEKRGRLLVTLSFLTWCVALVLLLGTHVYATTWNISSCTTLSNASDTYVLTSDVSSTGTCFAVTANGITLNGAGYSIFAQKGVSASSISNLVIQNVNFDNSTTTLINLITVTDVNGLTVQNTSFSSTQNVARISLTRVNNTIFTNNNFNASVSTPLGSTNNDILATTIQNISISHSILNRIPKPIQITSVNNFTFTNNSHVITTGNFGGSIYLNYANNTYISSSLLDSMGDSAPISDTDPSKTGVGILYGNNISIQDVVITPNGQWRNTLIKLVYVNNATLTDVNGSADQGAFGILYSNNTQISNSNFIDVNSNAYSTSPFAYVYSSNNVSISTINISNVAYHSAGLTAVLTTNLTLINNTFSTLYYNGNGATTPAIEFNGVTGLFVENNTIPSHYYPSVFVFSGNSTSNGNFVNNTFAGKKITIRQTLSNQVLTDSGTNIGLDICVGCTNVTYTQMLNTSAIQLGVSTGSFVSGILANSSIKYIGIAGGNANTISNNSLNATNISLFDTTSSNIVSNSVNGSIVIRYTNNTVMSSNIFNGTITQGIYTQNNSYKNNQFNFGTANNYMFIMGESSAAITYSISDNNFSITAGGLLYTSRTISSQYFTNNTIRANTSGAFTYIDMDRINFANNTFIVNLTAYPLIFIQHMVGDFVNNTVTGSLPASSCIIHGGSNQFYYAKSFSQNSINLSSGCFINTPANTDGSLLTIANNSFYSGTTQAPSIAIAYSGLTQSPTILFNNTIYHNASIAYPAIKISSLCGPYTNISNNTVTSTQGTHFEIVNSNNVAIYWNNITGSGGFVNNSNSNASFNTTVNGVAQGNYYPAIYGNTSVQVYDANFDGWADGYGAQEPVNATMWPSRWAGNGTDYAPATQNFGCGVLNRQNFVYNLTNTVYSGGNICFNITASNVTLDGRGFSLNGTQSVSSAGQVFAQYVNQFTLKNMLFNISVISSGTGLKFISVNNTLFQNNTAYVNNQGAFLQCSQNEATGLNNFTIINNSLISSIYLPSLLSVTDGNNILVANNTIVNPGTFVSYGYGPHLGAIGILSIIIENNTITGTGLYQGSIFSSRSLYPATIRNNNILVLASNQAGTVLEAVHSNDAGFTRWGTLNLSFYNNTIVTNNLSFLTSAPYGVGAEISDSLFENNTFVMNLSANTYFVNLQSSSRYSVASNNIFRNNIIQIQSSGATGVILNNTNNITFDNSFNFTGVNSTAIAILNYSNNTVINRAYINVTNATAIVYDQASDNLTINNSVVQITADGGSQYSTISVGTNRFVSNKFKTVIDNSSIYSMRTSESWSAAIDLTGGAYSTVDILNSLIVTNNTFAIEVGEQGNAASYFKVRNSVISVKTPRNGAIAISSGYGAINTLLINNNITYENDYTNSPAFVMRFVSVNFRANVTNNTILTIGNKVSGINYAGTWNDGIPTNIENNTFVFTGNYSSGFVDNYGDSSNAMTRYIKNNKFTFTGENATGINLTTTWQNKDIFTNNTFTFTRPTQTALWIVDAPNSTIYNNSFVTIAGNKNFYISGGSFSNMSPNVSQDNLINGQPITYAVNLQNYQLNGTYNSPAIVDQIVCINCKNVTFTNYNTTGNVTFLLSNTTTISNSKINVTGGPAFLIGSSISNVLNNNTVYVASAQYGLYSYDTSCCNGNSYLTIIGNRFNMSTTSRGIYLESGHPYLLVSNNTVNSTTEAIYGYNSPYYSRIDNNIVNVGPNGNGISVIFGGAQNNITNNVIAISSSSSYAGINNLRSTNTYIYNNTVNAYGGATGIYLGEHSISNTIVNRSTITTTGGGTGLYYGAQNPGGSSNVTVWDTTITTPGASTLSVNGPGANLSDTISLYNTTFSNITFSGTTVAQVFVYSYLQVNASRLGVFAIPNYTLNVIRNGLFLGSIATGSTGLSNLTLFPQFTATSLGILDYQYGSIPGLVARYTFDNDTKDKSGNGLDGALNGDATLNAQGMFNNTLFAATNGHVSIPDNQLFNTSQFTVSAWIKPTALFTSYPWIISKSSDGSPFGFFINGQVGSSAIGLAIGNGTSLNGLASLTLTLGQWNFVTIRVNATKASLFINGTEVSNGTMLGNYAASSQPLRIGAGYIYSCGPNCNMSIDEVTYYGRSLTTTEIQTLYARKNVNLQEGYLTIANSTNTYYISAPIVLNGTTFANIVAENPTANLNYSIDNDSIANYNYNAQYTYTKYLNITAYNSSALNLNLTIAEIDPNNHFLNTSNYSTNCQTIGSEQNCSIQINITLNIHATDHSPLMYYINYTNRNGQISVVNFSRDVFIAEFAQIGFSPLASLTYNGLLNDTNTTTLTIQNTGSTPTSTIFLTALNNSDAFTFLDFFDTPITQMSQLSNGGSATLKIKFILTNYTAANYTGVIRFNTSKLTQYIPFVINVTSTVSVANIVSTNQHNTSKNYTMPFSNAGNVPLQNLQMTFLNNDSLPASWLTYTTLLNTTLQPTQIGTTNITITVPVHQDPGTYLGTFLLTANNGLNQTLPISIIVPTNRSWFVVNMSMNVTNAISDSFTNEQFLPNITLVNNGNVPINLTVSPIFTGFGDIGFSPSTRFTGVTGQQQNPVPNIIVAKNSTSNLSLKVRSFLVSELPKINMGIGINLTLTNTTDSTNTSLVPAFIITIIDNPPAVGSWTVGLPPAVLHDNDTLEINKQARLSVTAQDDGNELNLSSGVFSVFDGVSETNYSYDQEISGKFFFNFTPTVNRPYNISFTIKENISAGAKIGTSKIQLLIATKPSGVTVDTTGIFNRVATNLSNQTTDVSLNTSFVFRVDGNVSIYNLSIWLNSSRGWNGTIVSYPAFTQNNTNVPLSINITVPKGTPVGNYSVNITANYTNPDYTNATAYATITVQVSPNTDFEVSLASTDISQQHGTNGIYTVTLIPRGNTNTSVVLSTVGNSYTVGFLNFSYTNPSLSQALITTASTPVTVRIQIPQFAYINNTFTLVATNAAGKTISTPINLTIPANSSMTASAQSVNKSVVAGDVAVNDGLVNITNTGNVQIIVETNLTGNISTLGLFTGGAGTTVAPRITIAPGASAPVYFNYTIPSAGGTFNGTLFVNSSATTNNTIPITFSAYQFTLSTANFTNFNNVRSGDTIQFITNLRQGITFLSTNITFVPTVDGTACGNVAVTPITIAGDPNFIVSCTVPEKSDGFDYTFQLQAIYASQQTGTLIVTSLNTGTVHYLDLTPPAITGVSLSDIEAGQSQTVLISGTDNVPITNANSASYNVVLDATRTATGSVTSTQFSRVLGSPGTFTGSVSYAIPGAYTYVVSITDPDGNVNSSYAGSFNVYQYRNYSSNITYYNDSNVLVGAYINLTFKSATNTTTLNLTNGTLNTTLKTDIYAINISDATSVLTLNSVDLLNTPTNNLFSYGQLKTNEYRVLSQSLFSDLAANNIFNGIFFKVNASTSFRLKYNYSTYVVSNQNGVRAYACYNYNLGADPTTACSGGFIPLTRTTLSTVQNYVVFDSPIATTPNQTVAIVFFSYVLIGQPDVTFAGPNISVTMNHNSVSSVPFSVTSNQNGGSLTGISFACINSSNVNDVCKNMTISSFSLTSLAQNQLQPFTITISVPRGLAAGTYSGTMRYQSNLNTSSPLLYDVPIYVTVLGSSSYTYTNRNVTSAISTGANTILTLDTYNFTNTGNTQIPLSFGFNGTLASASSLTLADAQTQSYNLQAVAPSTTGLYRYAFTFGSTAINYTVNVSQYLNITTVSPSVNITPGSNITVQYDLFDGSMSPSDIVQSSNQYFSSYSLTIDNITCSSSLTTALFDTFDPDMLVCTAPNQLADKNNYTLQLNVTRNGIQSSATSIVSYKDVLPPVISQISKNVAYQNISTINFTLADRSDISSSMTAKVSSATTGATIATYNSLLTYNASNTSAVGIFNYSASGFAFRHNYSAPGDYVVNITYCDVYSNCNSYIHNISHYPIVSFTPTQSAGKNSSIISAGVQTNAASWPIAPQTFNVSFVRPGTREELANATIDSSTGKINVTQLQNRTYDVVAASSSMDLVLSNVTYNGSDIIAFQQISVGSITDGKLGFGFDAPTNYSAQITYRVAASGSISQATFLVCNVWDYAGNTCTTTPTSVTPTNYSSANGIFTFTLNVSHFSAYILVIPPLAAPATTTTTTSSGSGGGGGGGGGASIGAIADLLNATVNNLSKVSQSFRDEVRADTTRIEQNLYPTETARVNINLVNTGNSSRKVHVDISPEISSVLTISPLDFAIPVGGAKTVAALMTAPDVINQTVFDGFVRINYEDQTISIPVKIRLLEAPRQPPAIAMNIITPQLTPTGVLRFQVSVSYPYVRTVPATMTYTIYKSDTDRLVYSDTKNLSLSKSETFDEAFPLNSQYETGNYYIRANLLFTDSNNLLVPLIDSKPFTITESIFFIQLFKIGNTVFLLWHLLVVMFVTLVGVSTQQYVKKKLDERKRYHLPVDLNLLPQPGPMAGYMGYLAETNQRAFVDFESLKMHTLVAGSTGGGKSFAAQVLVEEALKKNTAVVVFDPTAQWSGFLRKNTNENLLKLYSTFRLDRNKDPQAFKGNIRRVENPLEVIELKEYLKPGEITVFDCHKMTFEQIDLFVANTVSQVFMAELEESRDLKLLMVYDEVHRLLPKFGGSGAGFMQVERACREFRKWGIGVLLISQVLSDFIGQIKANINTEIQMRTRDEEDLKRLSLKYGDDLLHAVVKAEVGTGMVQNSKYNKGRPWLVSFRPVLHAVERLTEKELRDYDVYNTQLEDLADSLKQLEENYKVDILDMRIELDLAYDKLKEGKFDVVQIYAEELKSKVDKQWEKIKKKPTKRVKKLLDKKTVEKFLELAKKQHYEAASAEESAAAKQPAIQMSATAAVASAVSAATTTSGEKTKNKNNDATTTNTGGKKEKEASASKGKAATQKTSANSATQTADMPINNKAPESAKEKLARLKSTLGKK